MWFKPLSICEEGIACAYRSKKELSKLITWWGGRGRNCLCLLAKEGIVKIDQYLPVSVRSLNPPLVILWLFNKLSFFTSINSLVKKHTFIIIGVITDYILFKKNWTYYVSLKTISIKQWISLGWSINYLFLVYIDKHIINNIYYK